MLNKEEKDKLFDELFKEQKVVMKEILSLGRMALDDDKFSFFRKKVFNSFGISGLEDITKKILDIIWTYAYFIGRIISKYKIKTNNKPIGTKKWKILGKKFIKNK